jgi:hypothetical protein
VIVLTQAKYFRGALIRDPGRHVRQDIVDFVSQPPADSLEMVPQIVIAAERQGARQRRRTALACDMRFVSDRATVFPGDMGDSGGGGPARPSVGRARAGPYAAA